MKKFLRFVGILVLILLAVYLVLCLAAGKETVVEKSIEIDAPENVVWTAASDYNHWDNWNPWKEKDSTVTSTVTGPAGQVGQKSSWTSEHSGSGEMTIASIDGHTMTYDMHFIEPFDSRATGWVKTETKGNKTVATWGFKSESPFFMRGMSFFMKSMLEKSFARGMELLKVYAESGKVAGSAFDIQEITFPATNYASLRKMVKFADMEQYFQDAYGRIYAGAGANIDTTKPAAAIYYVWDMENMQSDMAPAFPITTSDDIAGLDVVRIPASPAYMLKYVGGYSGSYDAHMALNEHLAKNNKEMAMVIEEYAVSPEHETDSNKYVTNIYYITK